MNAEFVKKALEKIKEPAVLVNLVSSRVRQLNAGARPLLINTTGNLGLADIALLEIIEDKMTFTMPEIIKLIRPAAQTRKRPQGWLKQHVEKKAA
jgi:DNA-directed RNA polymerase subunit K/omega